MPQTTIPAIKSISINPSITRARARRASTPNAAVAYDVHPRAIAALAMVSSSARLHPVRNAAYSPNVPYT